MVVINDAVAKAFTEDRIFRIDHYLGKETVQNLMAVRFANALYEPLWNSAHIDHVQITVAEEIGVEGRGGGDDHVPRHGVDAHGGAGEGGGVDKWVVAGVGGTAESNGTNSMVVDGDSRVSKRSLDQVVEFLVSASDSGGMV